MKKSRNPKKTTTTKNREKRWAKVEQYLEEHIESTIWVMFVCADLRLVSNHNPPIRITWYIWYLEVNRPATKTSTRDTYSALSGLKIFILAKSGHKILFSLSQAFCQFWAHLLNFPLATPFTCLSSYLLWLLLLCS